VNRGFVHLLAKSTATPDKPQEHETLDGHILGVLSATRTLMRVVGHQFLDSMALSSAWFDVLERAVARGALLHDLGKANDHMISCVQ
jgi:CRISPR-associated endonuclease/helicase Cas3